MLPIPSRKHANNLDTWILAKPNSKTSLLHNLNFECGKESRPTKVHARIGSIRKKRITEISRNDAAKITWRQGEIGIKSVGYGNGSDNDSSYRDQSPRITQRDEFTPSLPLHPARIYIYIRATRTASQFLAAITPVYYNYATLHQRYKLLVRR